MTVLFGTYRTKAYRQIRAATLEFVIVPINAATNNSDPFVKSDRRLLVWSTLATFRDVTQHGSRVITNDHVTLCMVVVLQSALQPTARIPPSHLIARCE